MATTLITEIPVFLFSSQIDGIELSTDQEKLVITLEDGTNEIYRSTFYAYEGVVTIFKMREVIEDYMIRKDLSFCAFTMYYNTADGSNLGSFNLNTLFCSVVIGAEAGVFGSYNFLTTLSAKRIPRDAVEPLSVLHGQETDYVRCHCVFINTSDEMANASVYLTKVTTNDIGIKTFYISEKTIKTILRINGKKVKTLLSFTIEFNGRSISYYIQDSVPDVVFTFKNCFNVYETIYFSANTTTKTKVNRSLAISQDEHLFYDQSVEKSYEVQSASLTAEEAYWVEQLLFSHSVRLGSSSTITSLPEVIITESECEIADNDEEMNKVKFTWQFAKTAPHLQKSFRADNNGVFTEPYNATFD